jgi:hypothetical protein
MNSANWSSGMIAKNRTEHHYFFPLHDLSKLRDSSKVEFRWLLAWIAMGFKRAEQRKKSECGGGSLHCPPFVCDHILFRNDASFC